MQETWVLGANDPDFMGWTTTVAYLVAAGLCAAAAWRARFWADHGKRGLRTFWLAATGLLVLLGINKELDLQTPLLAAARFAAKAGGWYGLHEAVKWLFSASLAGAGLLLVCRFAWRLRDRGPVCGLALFGIALLLAYVALRAPPMQHVDSVVGIGVSGIRGKRHILELGGILCVGAAATVAYFAQAGRRRADKP